MEVENHPTILQASYSEDPFAFRSETCGAKIESFATFQRKPHDPVFN